METRTLRRSARCRGRRNTLRERRPLGERSSTSSVGAIGRSPASLQHAVQEQLRAAAAGGAGAGDVGHRSEVVQVSGPGGDQADRPHDPAPVPPALGQARVLAAVHHHEELVRAVRAKAARLEGERRVGVLVAAEPAAVQDDGRSAADALEVDQPAEAGGRARAPEAQPVAAHGSGVLRRHRPGVEDVRHGHGGPLRRRLAGPPAGRGRGLGGRRALRLALERGRRLRRSGRGGLRAHLPAARERLGAGELGRRGGSGQGRADGGGR